MPAVRKIEQKWRCTDGSEHSTQGAADNHQGLVNALIEFDDVKAKLAKLTVLTYKTADGKPLEFGRDYFFVVQCFGIPAIRRVSCWGWYNQKYHLQQDGRLDLIETVGVNQYKSFAVNELYSTEAAAKVEVDRLKRELIERLQKEIGE